MIGVVWMTSAMPGVSEPRPIVGPGGPLPLVVMPFLDVVGCAVVVVVLGVGLWGVVVLVGCTR